MLIPGYFICRNCVMVSMHIALVNVYSILRKSYSPPTPVIVFILYGFVFGIISMISLIHYKQQQILLQSLLPLLSPRSVCGDNSLCTSHLQTGCYSLLLTTNRSGMVHQQLQSISCLLILFSHFQYQFAAYMPGFTFTMCFCNLFQRIHFTNGNFHFTFIN